MDFSGRRERAGESLACCIIRLIAFEMRLAISFKLSNWLMDSTRAGERERARAVHAMDGCDRWEKHEFFLRTTSVMPEERMDYPCGGNHE